MTSSRKHLKGVNGKETIFISCQTILAIKCVLLMFNEISKAFRLKNPRTKIDHYLMKCLIE
jgi:hypothetical protein